MRITMMDDKQAMFSMDHKDSDQEDMKRVWHEMLDRLIAKVPEYVLDVFNEEKPNAKHAIRQIEDYKELPVTRDTILQFTLYMFSPVISFEGV